MLQSITAVVMVGPGPNLGPGETATDPVHWVGLARQAAARDLVDQLGRQSGVGAILVVAPNAAAYAGPRVIPVASGPEPIHVGERLASLVREHGIERLLYFGGGAAPLLGDEALGELIERLGRAESLVTTNNAYSSDWAGVVPAAALEAHVDRLPRDNMLGWILSQEGGLPLYAEPPSAATRLDIDTPADLLALRLVPWLRPHLRQTLEELPLDTGPLREALAVLATPAKRVFLAGRISPEAWAALNRASRCWLRVLAEERGMVASGREGRGEVYSLLADLVERTGLEAFFAALPAWADAAFFDTRVLWAHRGLKPGAAARFAADLGQHERIADPWIAAFTRLAASSPIPIILGGHTLLAGDLLALADLLATTSAVLGVS